jgi:hypothetical protein
MKKSDEKRARVMDLWKQQPENVRSSKDGVLKFYLWLQEHNSDALPSPSRGDPYQQLKVYLSDYIRPDQL